MAGNNHSGLVRAACSIAAQLPDDPEDAVTILRFAAQIIENLKVGGWEATPFSGMKVPATVPKDGPAILIEFPNKASLA